MKKNLLSIIILALLIVNIVLTAIMMFSVAGTSKKTAALVNNIASVLDLELSANGEEDAAQPVVTMKNTQPFNFTEPFQIPLKKGEDGKDHYYIVSVTLSMNKKDKGFKTFGETLTEKENLMRSEVIEVISSYTLDELVADPTPAKQEILDRIQKMFDSEFVYDVAFSDVTYN